MIDRRHFIGLAASTLAPAAIVRPALAQTQNWPTRFVRMYVPFTPGGGIDAIGRIVGAKLAEA